MNRRWHIAAVGVLGAVTVAGVSTARAAQAITSQDLKALQTHLKTDAESWIKGDLSDKDFRATAMKLKRVTYDVKSVGALTPLIRGVTGRSKPQDLYVANRLLRPLLMAKSDAIRRALPTVKQIHRSAGRYKPMPEYLRKVDKMAAPRGKATSLAVVAAIAASQRGLSERQQKAREITLWNEEVHTLKLILYELIVFAADTREDRELLTLLQRSEQAQLYAFIDICETIKKHIRTFDRSRAQAYHKALASLGARLRVRKGRYARHFEYRAHGGKLTPTWQDDYAGIRLLKAANLLAPTAGKSAVVVPTTKQVDAYINRMRK